MNLLEAEQLAIGHGRKIVASGIDLCLTAASVTCLLGPNGVGKTTLFRTLLGLIPPLSGSIRLQDAPLAGLSRAAVARRIAYVPQSLADGFACTVLDLVLMGRTAYVGAFATPGAADVEIALHALETLGIADQAGADTDRISGGQRQLALIARALAQQARVVVMDEPTASLDLGKLLRVLDRISRLAEDGIAVLLSTHDPDQAFAVADRGAILWREPTVGGGRFEVGLPADILTSQRLSLLYAVDLLVERTPTGRQVAGGSITRSRNR